MLQRKIEIILTELGSLDQRRTLNLQCFDTSKNIQVANPEFIHQLAAYGTTTLVKLVEFTLRFHYQQKKIKARRAET